MPKKEPLYPHVPKSRKKQDTGPGKESVPPQSLFPGEVEHLLSQVMTELKTRRDPAYMLWRLVDAAGLVSRSADPDALGQYQRATGRGYSLQVPTWEKR